MKQKSEPSLRSETKSASRRLVVSAATCGWAGYSPFAPGTVGTLLAIPIFPALQALRGLSLTIHLVAVALILVGSVWVAGAASEEFGERDSPHIVIDELAGYVVATGFLDFSWPAAALAFFLFRLFDILKPFPASWFDHHVRGGLGVVGDDVVAGIFAGVVARIVLRLL